MRGRGKKYGNAAENGHMPANDARVGASVSKSLFYPLYYAIRLRAINELRRQCRHRRALVLTFDDGPGRQLTQSLIQLLEAHGAKATFFLLGRRALRETPIVDRLQRLGHQIGVHSYRHSHAWKTSPSDALEDINAGYIALAPWVRPDGLFRPPYGKLSYSTWRALQHRNARICWWTIASGDTWPILPSTQRTADAVARAGGGVVLMHDFDRGPEEEAFVLRSTEILLKSAKQEGLNVLTMSDLFAKIGRSEK